MGFLNGLRHAIAKLCCVKEKQKIRKLKKPVKKERKWKPALETINEEDEDIYNSFDEAYQSLLATNEKMKNLEKIVNIGQESRENVYVLLQEVRLLLDASNNKLISLEKMVEEGQDSRG